MTENIRIHSDGIELEGLLNQNSKDKGVVITHPHPQYGGDMYNLVVSTIAEAYQKKAYTTLRFNFRGMGRSQGNFDNGVGEQTDVVSAVKYLSELGIDHVELAGYSFGAWVNAMATKKLGDIKQLILVSPPVDFLDFQSVDILEPLKLVTVGSNDEYASIDHLKNVVPTWNIKAKMEIVSGADHFYSGFTHDLENIVSSNI